MYFNTPFHIFLPTWLTLPSAVVRSLSTAVPIRMECWQEVVQQNISCAVFASFLPSIQLSTHTYTHKTQVNLFLFYGMFRCTIFTGMQDEFFPSNLALKYVRLS